MRFPQRQRVSYILAIAIAGWCAAKAPAQPPAARNISISPQRAGVTISQPLHLTASDSAGVTWASSGGILTNQTPTSATFTAKAAGLYTITATSKADTTKSAQATIGVTDLAGVTTWRNDREHSGINSHEYALNPQTLSTNKFGKLFSCPVDGWIFAQPLWMPNLQINGARHNVIFVASENDSLYAFDADVSGCQPVWSTTKVNLIPADEKIASLDDLEWDSIALGPFTGITGTPVIDPAPIPSTSSPSPKTKPPVPSSPDSMPSTSPPAGSAPNLRSSSQPPSKAPPTTHPTASSPLPPKCRSSAPRSFS